MSRARVRISTDREPLRLGFMPSSDCAPLVYASEAGLFAKYGLEVELRREARWSEIRDKIVSGELDAAQAPATLPFVANLGLDSDPFACVSGLVLNLQGNGIAISRELWDDGIRDAEGLREQIYRNWQRRTYTFAVTSLFSPEHLLLRQWLKMGGIIPEVEIRLVVVPPEQLFPTIKLGYIDAFSAGEPWIAVSVEAGTAKCVSSGAVLAPLHPVKVLIVRQSFATGRAEEHERLLAALMEACDFCNLPVNRGFLSEMLAPPEYVNAPAQLVAAGLPDVKTSGRAVDGQLVRANVFAGVETNLPSDERAGWIMTGLYEALGESVSKFSSQGRSAVLKNIFRTDIFARAKALKDGERKDHGAEWKPDRALTG